MIKKTNQNSSQFVKNCLIKLKSLENKQEIKRASKKELAKMVKDIYGL
jgi:hypothetical protein